MAPFPLFSRSPSRSPSRFQMLDAADGLVIERDDATEGAGPGCPDEPRTDCCTRPARFKRIYKFDLSQVDARHVVVVDAT